MERAAVILIGIVHSVIPLPRIIRHEGGLLMLILKLFEFVANLLKFLKRALPLRLIFWLLRVAHGCLGRCSEALARDRGTWDRRPVAPVRSDGGCPETPAVPGVTPPPWWCRLRGRSFVRDKLRNLAERWPG